MPEAFVIFFIFAVVVISFVAAWLRSRDPSLLNLHEDLQRLRHHEGWLRQRLELAQREQWDREMIAGLSDELRATSLQLARVAVRDRSR